MTTVALSSIAAYAMNFFSATTYVSARRSALWNMERKAGLDMHFDLYAEVASHRAWLFDAVNSRDANDLAAILSRTLATRVIVYRTVRPNTAPIRYSAYENGTMVGVDDAQLCAP